jgi:hypothetical protein
MKRRTMLMLAIMLAVVLLVTSTVAQATDPIQKQVAGVIRNTGSGWAQIPDPHRPINMASITNDSMKITVTYSFTADYVNTVAVTPDETMASQGYVVGVSVGLQYLYIYIYRNGVLINPNDYVNVRGNIWIYGLFEDNGQ